VTEKKIKSRVHRAHVASAHGEPEGKAWLCELKFDGYRTLAVKSGGHVQLRSRNNKDFNARYPDLLKALSSMPDETVIDGELVALDEAGRPSFNRLQNYGSAGAPLHFFIFDLLVLQGRDIMAQPLMRRRQLIESMFCRSWLTPFGIPASRWKPERPDPICKVAGP
jgi:ATP-dependent DNA ligase